MTQTTETTALLARIADALERIAPAPQANPDWGADTQIWDGARSRLTPVSGGQAVSLELLRGIDAQKETLLANTRRFAQGLPANNALLWGARGMGKSALVKAAHRHLTQVESHALMLIEIHAAELGSLGDLLDLLARAPKRAIVFCDDLAFAPGDPGYRALKALLEGGVAGRQAETVFYATSNRRHLMPREISENERSLAIHPDEEAEERISLSDRFGLWLGFHACPQNVYLDIVAGYAAALGLSIAPDDLRSRAIAWSAGRSARSGRTAWQFIQDLAGELGVKA